MVDEARHPGGSTTPPPAPHQQQQQQQQQQQPATPPPPTEQLRLLPSTEQQLQQDALRNIGGDVFLTPNPSSHLARRSRSSSYLTYLDAAHSVGLQIPPRHRRGRDCGSRFSSRHYSSLSPSEIDHDGRSSHSGETSVAVPTPVSSSAAGCYHVYGGSDNREPPPRKPSSRLSDGHNSTRTTTTSAAVAQHTGSRLLAPVPFLLVLTHPLMAISLALQNLLTTFKLFRVRLRLLQFQDYLWFALFFILCNVAQGMMTFGQNFYLASFEQGKKTFVSVFAPAVMWLVLNLLLIPIYKLWKGSEGDLTSFWVHTPKFWFAIIFIGIFDTFAGVFSVYSVPHIKVVLQTTLYSSSNLVMYLFHYIAYPETSTAPGLLVAVTFVCLAVALSFSLVSQAQQRHKNSDGSSSSSSEESMSVGWFVIFIFSILCPIIYNTFQGKYLSEMRRAAPDQVAPRLVSLTGDFITQVIIVIPLFTLDAAPWFGSSPSLEASWDGFTEGFMCLFECEYNGQYFAVYVLGYWFIRLLYTYWNMYSPTMGSIVMQITSPIHTFLLIIFPSLNLTSHAPPVGWTFGSFVFIFVSSLCFIVATEAQRVEQVLLAGEERCCDDGEAEDEDDADNDNHERSIVSV